MPRLRVLAAVAALAGTVPAPAPAQDPAPGDLASLVPDLADPSWTARERAADRLASAGARALPVLSEAVRSPRSEVASRALGLLDGALLDGLGALAARAGPRLAAAPRSDPEARRAALEARRAS
ncbi:MAG: hypothetical protein L0216_02900, partial [Planctomycetales bacterium]|nr:hypothetical protein [Planctomycetales bacterium]